MTHVLDISRALWERQKATLTNPALREPTRVSWSPDHRSYGNRETVTNHATVRGWHQSSPSPRPPKHRVESPPIAASEPWRLACPGGHFHQWRWFPTAIIGPARFYLKIAMFLGRLEKSMDPCKPQTNKKSKHKRLGELTMESDSPYATEHRSYEIRASEKAAPGGSPQENRLDFKGAGSLAEANKRRLK